MSDHGELTGRPRSKLVPEKLEYIAKLASKPPKDKPRWTVRGLAAELNMPVATVQRALVELEID